MKCIKIEINYYNMSYLPPEMIEHTLKFGPLYSVLCSLCYVLCAMFSVLCALWNRAISIPTNPICKRKQKRDYEKCFGILC